MPVNKTFSKGRLLKATEIWVLYIACPKFYVTNITANSAEVLKLLPKINDIHTQTGFVRRKRQLRGHIEKLKICFKDRKWG